MALDMTTFSAALKTLYSQDQVQNMVYKNNPFLALVQKSTDFVGKNKVIDIITGNPQGRAATFATAKANKTNSVVKAFTITRVSNFALASIDNETIDASSGNAGALISALQTEMDGAINGITRSIAKSLYGNGSGALGQVDAATTLTSQVIKLKTADSSVNFEVDMKLQVSATNGTGAVRSGTLTVTGVDRDADTVTCSSVLNVGISAIASQDYIFQEGDYGLMIKGLEAWIPATAPTSGDNFFGVDRSSDPTRLAGLRYDGSAGTKEAALINAAFRAAKEGATPSHCFMNYTDFAALEIELGSKVHYIDLKADNIVGFKSLQISGPNGLINIVPDVNCPRGVAYMLDLSMWKLNSLGPLVKIEENDSLKLLRDASSNSVELRIVSYAQLSCAAPGKNVRIKLA